VRRLLENGANTSFVHSFLDETVPAEDVARGPFEGADSIDRHPFIPAPPKLYGSRRTNSAGTDLSQVPVHERIAKAIADFDKARPIKASALVNGKEMGGKAEDVTSPANRSRVVGTVAEASEEAIGSAFTIAAKAQGDWDRRGGVERGAILRDMADALEGETDRLLALMAREAGKTLPDGIAEVREAVDFLRYYAAEAEQKFAAPDRLPGPAGETNHLGLKGRGTIVCISPWNFPLAIFTGQVAAALAADLKTKLEVAKIGSLCSPSSVRCCPARIASVDHEECENSVVMTDTMSLCWATERQLKGRTEMRHRLVIVVNSVKLTHDKFCLYNLNGFRVAAVQSGCGTMRM